MQCQKGKHIIHNKWARQHLYMPTVRTSLAFQKVTVFMQISGSIIWCMSSKYRILPQSFTKPGQHSKKGNMANSGRGLWWWPPEQKWQCNHTTEAKVIILCKTYSRGSCVFWVQVSASILWCISSEQKILYKLYDARLAEKSNVATRGRQITIVLFKTTQ